MQLLTGFASSASGAYLKSLRDNYWIRAEIAPHARRRASRAGRASPLTFAVPGSPAAATASAASAPAPGAPRRPPAGGLARDPRHRPARRHPRRSLPRPAVPVWLQPYLPIAVIAALDAVFGGIRAILDGIFNDKVFVVSFLSNVLVAAFIVFLGDQLGVGSQLSTGVVVVLGVRIFSNVASIRRHLFKA